MGTRSVRRELKLVTPKKNSAQVSIECLNGEVHTVHLKKDGAISFPDHSHRAIPLGVLAQEYLMMGKACLCCQAFAAGILSSDEGVLKKLHLDVIQAGNGFFELMIEKAFLVRKARKLSRKFLDPFGTSIRYRQPYVIAAKAAELLHDCTFRTTTTYHHKVSVVLITGKTTFKGRGIEPKKTYPDGTKKCFIKRRSFIEVQLNPRKWARVYNLCGGVVDEFSGGNNLRHFIYEIYKVKSENELYVHIMKQSRGYGLRETKAVIRRGHDGVWRIHAWPDAWP